MSEALQKLKKSLFLEQQDSEPKKEINISVPKLKNSNLYYWLALIPLFALALFIRTRNLVLLKGKYLIELDSYFFFRYAKMLFEQGSVPVMDMMRYIPMGFPTAGNLFFPKTLVFFYKIVHLFFPHLSQISWHVIYPPVITIISFIFFFLFIKELLNHRIAFIATAFLAVIPAYLQRTGAGFADHEAMAMLWMFISLWLFVVAWKSNNWKKIVPFAAVSGIFAGMMAGSWGGYTLLTFTISLFVLAYSILTNTFVKSLKTILPWALTYLASGAYLLAGGLGFIRAIPNIVLLFVLLFLILYFVINTKFSKIITKIKLPPSIITIIISALIGLAISITFHLINFRYIIENITKQNLSRHFYTVSENAQPYFTDWWNNFSWILLLAIAGSIFFFYMIFKSERSKKISILAAATYAIFFLAFIAGRYSTSSRLAGIVSFFSASYIYWLLGFLAFLALLYFITYCNKIDISSNWPWLLLAALFLVNLIIARGQIRLLFSTVPPMAVAAGVAISQIVDFAKTQNKNIKYIILATLIIFSLFAFGTATYQTKLENTYSGSMTPGQWEDAMTWIRDNTPENSVFAHWWDYGYLTIALGNRAAVTDGGNAVGWNYQSGRYFLTGKDDNSTLTYLKTHNVTHLLISDEEIMKYHAFSYIGSDENLDRQSTIGIFGLNQQKEVRNGTMLIYTGGWQLDKDYILGKLILSEQNAGIGGFSFVIQNDSITDPKAYVISNGQQFELPISCIIAEGKKMNFETTNDSFAGCLMLVPYFDSSGQGNPIGGAFWMSEKVWDTNFAKLYMYNETSPYYKQVYSDNTPLGIYNGRIVGPIKIWEVNYPANITADPFYLQSSPYG